MILKTKRYSPYYGHPKFSEIISIIIIFFVVGFVIAYFRYPWTPNLRIIREKKVPEIPGVRSNPTVSGLVLAQPTFPMGRSNAKEIEDFLDMSCILISSGDSFVSKRGTGFLVQDTNDSNYLFIVTAKHILKDSTGRLYDSLYLWISYQLYGKNTIKKEKVGIGDPLEHGPWRFHPSGAFDVAIYHFKIGNGETFQFFDSSMLSFPISFGRGSRIKMFGFGDINPKEDRLLPRRNEGDVQDVEFEDNKWVQSIQGSPPKIYRVPGGHAFIDMEKDILFGESGSPVILNPSNLQSINEIRLVGIFIGYPSQDTSRQDRKSCGTIVLATKIKELTTEFYKGLDKTLLVK